MYIADDPQVRAEARVGSTLGEKWRLDRLLGVGGMASVYAASHRNGATAAIKILNAEYARSTDIRSRFMREGYIANAAGPGAVRVLDDDVDDDGAPFLVMELLSGEPVDARAARSGGRLRVMEVLWVASETLATLEIAHANGIIHRDLKPANLFWTVDDALKVLDFGIARLHSNSSTSTAERTVSGTVLGTPAFMAHEQALGLSTEIDARTDLWAVGAIMFHLLTGRDVHPREGNTLVLAATEHAVSLSTVDASLPADLVAIVDRALKFEQSDRFPTARAMREAVLRLAGPDALRDAIGSAGPPPRHRADPTAFAPTLNAPKVPSAPPPGLATGMSDDDTLALRKVLELIEMAILTREELLAREAPRFQEAARLGAFRRLEMAYRHAVTALDAAHIGLFWNVLPEGFATKQGLLWVAKPPLPPTPEKMFASGVRMLGLLPGLSFEDFGEVTRIIHGDLAPFTDFATLLQSSRRPHLVYRIDPTKPGMPEHPSISIDSSLSGKAGVLPMIDALTTSDPALRAALLHRLERIGEGQEGPLGALLPTASVELAMGLLRVLEGLGTDAARVAMENAVTHPAAIVRIAALSQIDPGGERLQVELKDALSSADAAVRMEHLVALDVYKVTAAGPALALRLTAGSFDMLPATERRQALATLAGLLPARAETIAVRLLSDKRVISTEPHEVTRELCCEVLGRIGSSRQAEEALLHAVQDRAKASERVRIAASVALDAFGARAAWGGSLP